MTNLNDHTKRFDINLYQMKANGGCRGCDKSIPKGTTVVYTYSSMGRGQHIFLCLGCCNIISDLVNTENQGAN